MSKRCIRTNGEKRIFEVSAHLVIDGIHDIVSSKGSVFMENSTQLFVAIAAENTNKGSFVGACNITLTSYLHKKFTYSAFATGMNVVGPKNFILEPSIKNSR